MDLLCYVRPEGKKNASRVCSNHAIFTKAYLTRLEVTLRTHHSCLLPSAGLAERRKPIEIADSAIPKGKKQVPAARAQSVVKEDGVTESPVAVQAPCAWGRG